MMMNKSRVDTSMFCKKFIEKMKYQKWKKNDSIILLNIFDWIMKESSWRLIKNKLNMYMWHQRNDLNITRHDWLRIFMYIMLQQLIRQNLLYYVIIMTLRSNHEINLIAFSYYIKCMLKNYFVIVKHLDVNVFDLLSDRSKKTEQNTRICNLREWINQKWERDYFENALQNEAVMREDNEERASNWRFHSQRNYVRHCEKLT